MTRRGSAGQELAALRLGPGPSRADVATRTSLIWPLTTTRCRRLTQYSGANTRSGDSRDCPRLALTADVAASRQHDRRVARCPACLATARRRDRCGFTARLAVRTLRRDVDGAIVSPRAWYGEIDRRCNLRIATSTASRPLASSVDASTGAAAAASRGSPSDRGGSRAPACRRALRRSGG